MMKLEREPGLYRRPIFRCPSASWETERVKEIFLELALDKLAQQMREIEISVNAGSMDRADAIEWCELMLRKATPDARPLLEKLVERLRA